MCTSADYASRFRCDGVYCSTDFHCESRNCVGSVCEARPFTSSPLFIVGTVLLSLAAFLAILLYFFKRHKIGCWREYTEQELLAKNFRAINLAMMVS